LFLNTFQEFLPITSLFKSLSLVFLLLYQEKQKNYSVPAYQVRKRVGLAILPMVYKALQIYRQAKLIPQCGNHLAVSTGAKKMSCPHSYGSGLNFAFF